MHEPAIAVFTEHLSEVKDPRSDNERHLFLDIIVIAICAVICAADTWADIELFGTSNDDWFKQFLKLPHGIPSRNAFLRLFARLNPEQFPSFLVKWVQAAEKLRVGQVVALDGKPLRRSHDRASDKEALHLVSGWASKNRLLLGQRVVDDKSSEITAIPQLLDIPELSGCIVTIDAIGCQTAIVEKIIDQKADYVLPVKKNLGRLHEAVRDLCDDPAELRPVKCHYHKTVNEGHGRIEIRECWTSSDPEYLQGIAALSEWKGLQSTGVVQAERRRGHAKTVKRRYFISSLSSDARRMLHTVRTHWEIETTVHWILDVVFREDDCRVRKGDGAQNFAVLRHIALNLLRREKTTKRSVRSRRWHAGWDKAYLLKALTA